MRPRTFRLALLWAGALDTGAAAAAVERLTRPDVLTAPIPELGGRVFVAADVAAQLTAVTVEYAFDFVCDDTVPTGEPR